MPIVGAIAAALALLAADGEHRDLAAGGAPAAVPVPRIAARLAEQPTPVGAYVAGMVQAMSPSAPTLANGPHHDGMSLRELRVTDLSGQTTWPLLAGRF